MNHPDWRMHGAAAGQMRSPVMEFDSQQRAAIEISIRESCAYRGWEVLALNVRTNHVHLVVAADAGPDAVVRTLKARTTRQLRAGKLAAAGDSVWSRGGSHRVLWSESAVDAATDYTLNRQ